MKTYKTKFILLIFLGILMASIKLHAQADDSYVQNIRDEMLIKWPNNRTINIVFHGHSVPTGYYTAGEVFKFGAYPHLALEQVKGKYPYAVINFITTSIGGEQAERGETRFANEVLTMRPDVLFIDYALNDRNIVIGNPQQSLQKAKVAWQKMIDAALAHSFTDRNGNVHKVKVILMTPTPDTREDISSDESPLAKHAAQIRQLAKDNNVGLIDSYALFKDLASRESLSPYMAQANHINEKGHQLVANEIAKLFIPEEKIEDGLYYVKGNFSARFWTVKDGASANNTQIVINDSLGTDNQKFYIKKMTDGYYITPFYNNKALGMEGENKGNGANLVIMDSTGVANECFSFSPVGNGYFWITNNNSSIYIATPGTQKDNGTKVFQWQFYNNPNFQWKLIPAEDPLLNAGSSILKSNLNYNLKIYPNPSKGKMSIIKPDNTAFDLNIFSLDGKQVSMHKISSTHSELSLSNSLQPGMYLFEFSNKNTTFVKQLLVR